MKQPSLKKYLAALLMGTLAQAMEPTKPREHQEINPHSGGMVLPPPPLPNLMDLLPQELFDEISRHFDLRTIVNYGITSKIGQQALAPMLAIYHRVLSKKGGYYDMGNENDKRFLAYVTAHSPEKQILKIHVHFDLGLNKITLLKELVELVSDLRSLDPFNGFGQSVDRIKKAKLESTSSPLSNPILLNLYGGLLGKFPLMLTTLTNITALNLSHCTLYEQCMPLFSHLTNLQSLDLSNTGLCIGNMGRFAELRYLTSLNLKACTFINKDHVNNLSLLTMLTFLDVGFTNIQFYDGLTALVQLTNLRSLKLENDHIKDRGPVAFSKLINLTLLDLSKNKITSTSKRLKRLSKLSNLKSLSLRDTPVRFQLRFYQLMTSFKNLESLSCGYHPDYHTITFSNHHLGFDMLKKFKFG
jgi:Leucine rich repeat